MSETTHTLDARGLSCPLPILKTRKAIATLGSGDVLEIISSDPGSVKDLDSFCTQTGHQLITSEAQDDGFFFRIRKA
jgi:tRNA 2-thiouridine synthesizing protein A